MVWSGLSGNICHIDCIISIVTSIYGIQGSRISRLHLSLFTVYKRVLHIIQLARYYIDMQIIFLDHRKKEIDSFILNPIYISLYTNCVKWGGADPGGGGA